MLFAPASLRLNSALLGLALGYLSLSGPAHADVQHVVARGHTILSIAHRYHVSAKAILEANHLKDPNHLKVGSTLTIPGATAPAPMKGKTSGEARGAEARSEAKGEGKKGLPTTYAQRPKTPGVVHVTRLATNEDFSVRVAHRGHASPTALKTFEKMMRNGGGLTHPIEPRLISLVGTVSDHFGSRRLEVISGFRPFTTTQYTHHSNHNIGHAIDFRVVGVPNEVLRDYCRTLHNVGVGYYPNSTFVHLDVRTSPAFWIDYSHPGEPPRYNTPNAEADEGTSDVSDEPHAPESSVVPDGPTAPPSTLAPLGGPPSADAPKPAGSSPAPLPAPDAPAGSAAAPSAPAAAPSATAPAPSPAGPAASSQPTQL